MCDHTRPRGNKSKRKYLCTNKYFRPLNEGVTLTGDHDPSWLMKLPLFVLTLLVVGLGLFSQPLVIFLRQIASGIIF